ncbi:MAG: matrixin family metalloprotease [Myxococcales bacterium]|nr:matrixin family metalloprotease [Myxococcales bacterium]
MSRHPRDIARTDAPALRAQHYRGIALTLGTFACATLICASAAGFQLRRIQTGEPVRWHQERVSFHLNLQSVPSYLDSSRVLYIVQQSFATWNAVESSFLRLDFGGTTTQRTEYDRNGDTNVNTVYFETVSWDDDSDVLALTKTIYEPKTGEIKDADIRVNAVHFTWSTSDSNVQNDVQNMLTHEVGHLLGLEHSDDEESTMYATSKAGEMSKRTLAQDDINGVSYLYPSDKSIPQIAPDDQPVTQDANVLLGRYDDSRFKYGCNTVPFGAAPTVPLWLGLLALGAVVFGGRRWRRSRLR